MKGTGMTASISEGGAWALAILASEWFRTARRLMRVTQQNSPTSIERERAQLAHARSRIDDALAQNGLRMVTHDGAFFSAELPVEPVNPEDFDTEEGLVVQETIEPTVVLNGRVVIRGRVVLARVGS